MHVGYVRVGITYVHSSARVGYMYVLIGIQSAQVRLLMPSALPPTLAVQRRVAQGCSLSPLLYEVFILPVLQDMQTPSRPALPWGEPVASQQRNSFGPGLC